MIILFHRSTARLRQTLVQSLTIPLIIVLTACGGGSSNPNANPDSSLDPDEPAPTMPPLYSIELRKSGENDIDIGKIEFSPSLAGAYRPTGNLTGEFVAMAYAGDQMVDVVPVHFPTDYIEESFSDDLQFTGSVTGQIAMPFTRIHLDATQDIDRVEIIDATQTVVASTFNLPERSAGLRSTRPFANYPWIDLLDESDAELYIDDAGAVFNLIGLTAQEISTVQTILDAMPKRLLSAIDSLGFGNLNRPGMTYGGSVLIDYGFISREPGRLYHLLSHEAGHAYHNASATLAAGTSFADWASAWPADTLTAISQTHEEFGFDRDLLHFWRTIQSQAQSAGLASAYTNADDQNLDNPHLQGFVSSYAASKITDDIADSVAIASMKTTSSLSPAFSARACSYYQQVDELRKEDAMAYIKLRLVQAFGLAKKEDVDWCLGDAAPITDPGIHLGEVLLFDRQLKAGYTGQDRQRFNVVGQDTEGRGLAIELQTEGRHPTGVYPLDPTWWGNWNGDNTLVLSSPNEFEARTGNSGIVVISYANSSERVDGFVFNLELWNAFGPVSNFPFVPFRIPF